jgi:hypothetical protein
MQETVVQGKAYDGQCDINVKYTMIPAFSVGTLTVGLSIHCVNPVGAPTACASASSVYAMGRFVRDERSAETLIVSTNLSRTKSPSLVSGSASAVTSESSCQPRSSIIYLRHDSSTQRFHLFAACDPDLFSRGRYAESVVFAESDVQIRFCPVCSSSPSAMCACVLPLCVPKSALDFSAFLPNCSTHYGSFHNKSSVSFRDVPAAAFGRAISSKMALCAGFSDKSIAQLLQNLAIQDRMERVNPCRAIMPAAGEASLSDALRLGMLDDTLSPAPDIENLFDGPDIVASACLGWIDDVPDAEDVDPHTFLPVSSDGIVEQQRTDSDHLPSATLEDNDLLDMMDLVRGKEVLDVMEGIRVSQNAAVSPAMPQQSDPFAVQKVALNCSGVSERRESISMEAALKNAKQLERQRKNRAAAARSNAKRKLVMDTLKGQVDDARNCVRELQEKEAQLKAENQALKDLAARRWRDELKRTVSNV